MIQKSYKVNLTVEVVADDLPSATEVAEDMILESMQNAAKAASATGVIEAAESRRDLYERMMKRGFSANREAKEEIAALKDINKFLLGIATRYYSNESFLDRI